MNSNGRNDLGSRRPSWSGVDRLTSKQPVAVVRFQGGQLRYAGPGQCYGSVQYLHTQTGAVWNCFLTRLVVCNSMIGLYQPLNQDLVRAMTVRAICVHWENLVGDPVVAREDLIVVGPVTEWDGKLFGALAWPFHPRS